MLARSPKLTFLITYNPPPKKKIKEENDAPLGASTPPKTHLVTRKSGALANFCKDDRGNEDEWLFLRS